MNRNYDMVETRISAPRIAVWDRYGGSMESGWTQYVLDRFAFPHDVIYHNDIDGADLKSKYDVILLPDGAIPGGEGRQGGGGGESVEEDLGYDAIESMLQNRGQVPPLNEDPTIPLIWRQRNRPFSAATLESLKRFAENGGHLVCIGSSALNIAGRLSLPVENALVDDKGVRLPNSKFYIPGSIMRVNLEKGPLTQGMGDEVDVMFDNSPSFRLKPGAERVGYYASDKTLRSGWAWGQELLKDTAAIADVPYGKGRVVLFGPEVLFRGQPFGTFKLVFNAIYRSTASPQ